MGVGKDDSYYPTPPSPSFRPSLSHLVQNYYSPQLSIALKIKDDSSYNFHQENTVHLLLSKSQLLPYGQWDTVPRLFTL